MWSSAALILHLTQELLFLNVSNNCPKKSKTFTAADFACDGGKIVSRIALETEVYLLSVRLKNPSDFSWIKRAPSLSNVAVFEDARRAISSLLKIIFLPLGGPYK